MSVTAAPEVQARLLDLAGYDGELGRIAARRREARRVAPLQEAAAERLRIRGEEQEQRDRVDELRRELRRIETDVELVEQRLLRDRERLAATSSAKDAQSFEQEIASLERRRGALEDTELETMEGIESAESTLAALTEALEGVDARIGTIESERDEELARLLDHEQGVLDARAALVEELPKDLVELYERQRSRYGIGAALLRGGVSGGSNMSLTGADLEAVRRAAPDAVVLDPESGCILVRTDESGL